ncbi:Esterase-like activity of phytase [Amycolatopsis marina]|uniref:Esterase-like activity of phytase n=1 Tax=Amycolatopsis marina TaxID=490629 RepID=A0A1I0VP18_9PSEU|nr:Esterase-like activity of phytase [Amycolatopsis marina]
MPLVLGAAPAGAHSASSGDGVPRFGPHFQRTATLPVYRNSSPEETTAAEIAAATPDGRTVVYTDSPGQRVGIAALVGATDLRPAGTIAMPGEPTSVDIVGNLALIAVNTSASYTEPSGLLQVIDLDSRQVVASHDLGGQPDSIDISPDGRYAAIAMENERDEDTADGQLPQAPAGFLHIVDLAGDPDSWQVRRTELTGLAEVTPEDPEPEYVSINSRNEVAVTLQENNHIAIVGLREGNVLRHFSAGTTTVDGVDTVEDGRIDPSGSVTAPREPDSISWLDDDTLGTADEGDYQGGSRTWTVFDAATGEVIRDSGNELENLAISYGQYPEHRAENKGVEPEGIAVATYGRHRYAFVGLERANLVAVYEIDDPRRPRLVQGLPTGVAPEGILPIPKLGTLVVSAEEDSAEDGVRSSLGRYRLTHTPLFADLRHNRATPSVVSTGIGFGALSGLSGIPGNHREVVAVTDDAYGPSRVLTVDARRSPAVVHRELQITRDGAPVTYDAEGIAALRDGGYWLAAEGKPKDGIRNLLVRLDSRGVVRQEVALPPGVEAGASSNGFEGVAVVGHGRGEQVWVAVQREWRDNRPGEVTFARYTPATGEWAFAAYALETAPDGGWVGLSELTALDDDTLLVLERDNQRGANAALKKVFRVEIARVRPVPEGQDKPVLRKSQVRDLLPELAAGGGEVADKPEGLAVLGGPSRFGSVDLVGAVDNDGLDDAPGESMFLRLGRVSR